MKKKGLKSETGGEVTTKKRKASAAKAEEAEEDKETTEVDPTPAPKKRKGKTTKAAVEEKEMEEQEEAPAPVKKKQKEKAKTKAAEAKEEQQAAPAQAPPAEEAAEEKPRKKSKQKKDSVKNDAAEANADEAPAEERAKPRKKSKADRLAATAKAFEEGDDGEEAASAEKAAPKIEEKRGVVYIGRVPKGFEENQMRGFFKQFGEITRLRLAHSKKTGGFKGYGWIEFRSEEVAKIVAETMNKYMLSGKTLVCRLVPPDQLHPATMKGANRMFQDWRPKRRNEHLQIINDRPTVEVNGVKMPQLTQKQVQRAKNADKRWKEALSKLGVEYDFNPDVTVADGDPDIIA